MKIEATRRSDPTSLRLLAALALLFAGFALPPAVPTARAADVGVPVASGPTVESIETKIADLTRDTRLEAAIKSQVLDSYTNALSWVRAAGEKQKVAADFINARTAIPGLLAELEASRTNAVPAPELPAAAAPTNAPLKSLETTLTTTLSGLAEAEAKLTRFRDEPARRGARSIELASSLTEVKGKLGEQPSAPAAATPDDPKPEVTAAASVLAAARKLSLTAEVKAAEEEQRYLESSADLVAAQTDHAARTVTRLSEQAEALRQTIAARRRVEGRAALAEAEQLQQGGSSIVSGVPWLEAMASENLRIAARRTGPESIASRIETASMSLQALRVETAVLDERFDAVERRVQALERANRSIDDATGLLLRRTRATLLDASDLRSRNRITQDQISSAQLELFDLQDDRAPLNDLPGRAKRLVDEATPRVDPERRQEFEAAATQLLEARRDYLDGLIGDYNALLKTLLDLDTTQRSLLRRGASIAAFVDERILWIRSAPRYSTVNFAARGEAFRARFPVEGWEALARFLRDDFRQSMAPILMAVGLFAFLLILRRRIGSALDQAAAEATQARSGSFRPTANAFLGTVVLSITFPLLAGFLGWRLTGVLDEAPFAPFIRSVGDGLLGMSVVLATLEFYRHACRPNGLAEAHFGWARQNTRLAHRNLAWLTVVMIPLAFFIGAIEGRNQEASFGQLFFMLAMLALALFAHRLLHPVRGLGLFAEGGGGKRLARLVYLAVISVPLGLGLAAWFGFYYTTLELAWRFEATVWLILGVLLIHAMILRWFVLVRRRWALEQARKRRAAQLESKDNGTPDSAVEAPPVEPEITFYELNLQTRSLIRLFVTLLIVGGLWATWSGVFPALNTFKRIDVWQLEGPAVTAKAEAAPALDLVPGVPKSPGVADEGSGAVAPKTTRPLRTSVTVADLFWFGIVVILVIAGIRNIPGLLELTVLSRLELQAGVGYAISTVVRYLIGLVGVIVGFGLLGVSWSNVQWLAAAVTVGIGFGLQEIFANFVSGLIILFERPIRVGDIVTVGDVSGNVTKINIRATTVTDWDRREFIIPNREFITGKVLNWTLTDPVTRVLLTVGIAYGSDVGLAEKLLLKIADESPYVMKDPAPRAIFWGFGDNSLEFRLYVHIPKRNIYLEMLHGLTTSIDREFRAAKINIAFPQRDVHLHTSGPLQVELAGKSLPSAGEPEPAPHAKRSATGSSVGGDSKVIDVPGVTARPPSVP